jgi:hypothetical protein
VRVCGVWRYGGCEDCDEVKSSKHEMRRQDRQLQLSTASPSTERAARAVESRG